MKQKKEHRMMNHQDSSHSLKEPPWILSPVEVVSCFELLKLF